MGRSFANNCLINSESSLAQGPVPAIHFTEKDGSTPLAFSHILIFLLAANCIFFQADLFSEPTLHEGRSPASKRLVPGAVLGVGSQDLVSAEIRQIIRP
jgi:hypothetical protein